MKTLWHAMSFMAVVNLLAMAMFAGWLWRSGRLSPDRVEQVKEIFALTVAEQEAEEVRAAAEAEAEGREAAQRARQIDPPLSTEETLAYISRLRAEEQQSRRRLALDVQALEEDLNRRAQTLDLRENRLDARDRAWQDANASELARRTDEQFQKTVKLYSSVPPKQAKQYLVKLVEEGKIEQAVAYIDAMNERAASKIIRELKIAEEVALATELLEELRTFGLPPEASEESGNDDALASAE